MRLRLLELKDAEGMLEWMHDPNVNCYFRFDAANMTRKQVETFIKQSVINAEHRKSYNLAIAEDDDTYLGTISLKNVDWDKKSAEYAISMRASAQGRGVATWATKEILRYAFETLDLHKVHLNVLLDNEKAVHVYEKCGFQYIGMCEQSVYIGKVCKQLKLYEITQEKWLENKNGDV